MRCLNCNKKFKGGQRYKDLCSNVCYDLYYPSFEAALWKRIDKTPGFGPKGDCWEWTGCKGKRGYGSFTWKRVRKSAHRAAYEVFYSQKLEKTTEVCHECDNPPCCNPMHLFLGTRKDNIRDMYQKGRGIGNRKGENHPSAKISNQDIQNIRILWETENFTQKQLAEKFNLTQSGISKIVNKRTRQCG